MLASVGFEIRQQYCMINSLFWAFSWQRKNKPLIQTEHTHFQKSFYEAFAASTTDEAVGGIYNTVSYHMLATFWLHQNLTALRLGFRDMVSLSTRLPSSTGCHASKQVSICANNGPVSKPHAWRDLFELP